MTDVGGSLRENARIFLWLAAAGLVASVVVHVCSWLGLAQPFGFAVWGLHVGIFVVWIPAVLVGMELTGGSRRLDS